jgi:putative intracellular protease/amidase
MTATRTVAVLVEEGSTTMSWSGCSRCCGISAGAIAGRTVTCRPSIAVDVRNAGGFYVDRPVVEDRGVFTARKIDDIAALVQAVLGVPRTS